VPCRAWVTPLIWGCFIPSWLLPTKSREFIKYWDSGLNARRSRTFIATVHIAEVIGWRRSGKKGVGKLSLALNLLLNWVSCPVEAQCTFFFLFLKSHPLCDQTGGSRAVFSGLYGWLYCVRKSVLLSVYMSSEFRFRSLIRIATTEEGQAANETKGI
jgi:hypothetical protein